jgi:hypothetical protein
MKFLLYVACFVVYSAGVFAQNNSVTPADLASLEGSWIGTLTYVDYSTNKSTNIRADLRVTSSATGSWTFEYIYPLEPKANSRAELKLSSDGRFFDGEEVIARKLVGKVISMTTIKKGKDNGRDATFRRTFSIERDSFSILKGVKIDGTDVYFERNTYRWMRQQ